jgi:hypothetical protein
MRWLTASATVFAVLAAACGGDDDSSKCAGAACPGGAGGAGGTSGTTSSGGSGAAGVGNGGAGASGGGGSPSDACAAIGGTLAGQQACYVPCVYDGSLVPTYDRNGDCTRFGSKCGNFNYCMPNITCTANINCGAGRACALGGQCLIACATDADCPAPPSGAPLLCKPVDTGTLVCRPYP